jgi:DNA-binding transcriptional MocR family regulator
MKIAIDKASSISVHKQIYAALENRILSGILEPETKLPSLRKMCVDSGVSHMTMVRVYDDLEAHGLVEKLHGKGTYVKSQFRNMSPAQVEQGIDIDSIERHHKEKDKWQDSFPDYVSAAGFRFNNNLKHAQEGVNLSVSCLGPHLTPSGKILDLFLKNEDLLNRLVGPYPSIEGLDVMSEASSSLLSQRNVSVSPGETLITVGSQQAISLIARTYIGPGDVVVVSAPTYPGVLDVFKNRGAVIVEVPIDRDGMDTMALLSVCEAHPVKMVYTMPSFHNPTGAVMSMKRKKALLELADYYNFIILEDDVAGQLAYDCSTLPLKALDENGRVLYVLGFSKIYGHAFRLSVITASKKLLLKIASVKSSSDGGAPIINQLIMASFIGSDAQKHYLTDLTSHLKKVRDTLYAALVSMMPDYVHIEKPKGGMVFWMTFPSDFNCNLLHYKCIEKYRINFLPGEFCYSSKSGRNQMRLCFTNVEKETFVDASRKIAGLIEEVYVVSQLY